MLQFIDDHIGKIIIVIIALVFIGLGFMIKVAFTNDQKFYDNFMSECQQDHKHYECVALWRRGTQK